MNTPTIKPLDEAEVTELREYLAKQKEEQEALSIEEAHGYMAGLICGPEVVHPSVWLSTIFNGSAEFDSLEHEERIIENLIRLYNSTVKSIQAEEVFSELYYPLHPTRTGKDINFDLIQDWCDAFMVGAADDEWAEIEDFQMIIFPIMISSVGDDEAPMLKFCEMRESSVEDVRRYFFEFITPSVHQLYSYIAQVKHHVDMSMLEESGADDEGDEGDEAHACHEGCGTVH